MVEEKRPVWSAWEASDVFQKDVPSIDKCEASMKLTKPGMTQAQQEELGAKTQLEKGWKPRASNDRGCDLDEFGTKARHRMGRTELKFADQLDKQLATLRDLERQDMREKTDGKMRRERLVNNPYSSLSRSDKKLPWCEQLISNQVCFSAPDPDPPGSNGGVGLGHYVEQPERTTSFERDFVAGSCDMTSHWRAPVPGQVTGSMKGHAKARAMLNPRGCPALLQDEGHRKCQMDANHPAEIFRRLEKQRAADLRHWKTGRADLSR